MRHQPSKRPVPDVPGNGYMVHASGSASWGKPRNVPRDRVFPLSRKRGARRFFSSFAHLRQVQPIVEGRRATRNPAAISPAICARAAK